MHDSGVGDIKNEELLEEILKSVSGGKARYAINNFVMAFNM
jgi:hypothetical protein